MSPYQNVFFVELADALCDALGDIGVEFALTTEPGEHVVRDNDVFVLLPPHEYVTLEGDAIVNDPEVAARTVGLSAEQPHQSFFERNAAYVARLGAVFDFSRLAVGAYRAAGIEAHHLQFGYVPAWDRVRQMTGPRRIETDVLYLGNKKQRRLSTLASAAEVLSERRARLVIGDNSEPNRSSDAGFYSQDRKRDLLAASGLVVNIHQSDEPYFEWLRFAETAHCGAPMLTERSIATEPFVDEEHFLSFERAELAVRLREVVKERSRLDEVAAAAYQRLIQLPLTETIQVLVDAATELLKQRAPSALPARTRTEAIGRDRSVEVTPTPEPWSLLGAVRDRSRSASSPVTIAPAGTQWRVAPDLILATTGPSPLVTVLADGIDSHGRPMLEGLWSWEPWRLWSGQHLGRVLLANRRLNQRAQAWLDEPMFDLYPHLRVQLYAVVHGIVGTHVASPHARLAVSVDESHELPDDVATRCRQLLAGAD